MTWGGNDMLWSSRGTPVDAVAPTIENVSPVSGSSLEATDPITFDVADETGIFHAVFVWVRFPDGTTEVVFDGDAFTDSYEDSGREATMDGWTYTVRRSRGWPRNSSIQLRIKAIDGGGNDVT